MNDENESRLVYEGKGCVILCNGILLPGLSRRRKGSVNHAKKEETRECQGCLGRGWVTLVTQSNAHVNGIIRHRTVVLDSYVGYGYSSSRRGYCVMWFCISCRQKKSFLSGSFISNK